MYSSTDYRDAARINMVRQLEELKEKKSLVFKNINTGMITMQSLDIIPDLDINDEKLIVFTDAIVDMLTAYPYDPMHTYLEVEEQYRFYYRFVNAMHEILFRAVSNANKLRKKTLGPGDFLCSLYVLQAYGISEEGINALYDTIKKRLNKLTNSGTTK